MPTFKIDVGGLSESDTALRRFAATVTDLTPFSTELGRSLAARAEIGPVAAFIDLGEPWSRPWRHLRIRPRQVAILDRGFLRQI